MNESNQYIPVAKLIEMIIIDQSRIISKLQHEILEKENLLENHLIELYSDRLPEFTQNLCTLINIKSEL